MKTDAEAMAEILATPLYHAFARMESNCDVNAENPKSSAKGIFQLIKATREALGVTNWRSPAQQLEALKHLLKRNKEVFQTEDPEKLYAAHYLGEPTYQKLLHDKELTEGQQQIVDYFMHKVAPRFNEIVAEVYGSGGIR